MKLVDLSVEDQELLLALIEIAREEGNANRDWDEIEPVLAPPVLRRPGNPS